MMRILTIICCACVLSFSQMETPVKGTEIVDIIDPAQKKKDRKIWKNILCVYGQVRQTAEGTIEIVNGVADYALKSFAFLKKAEQMVGTVISLGQSFKELGQMNLWNPFELIKAVEHTHEQIFCNGTELLLAQAEQGKEIIESLEETREGIVESGRNIGKTWSGEEKSKSRSALSTATKDPALYQSQYELMQALALSDPELLKKHSYRPEAKLQQTTIAVASDGIAGAAVRSISAENQVIMAQYAMSEASGAEGDDNESAITAQAVGEAIASQNALLGSYSEHETMNSLTKVLAMTALNRADTYVMGPHSAKVVVISAVAKFSEEVRKYDSQKK